MLTYRGDKFVRGKKFIINECEYYFSKYDADKTYLIFEDTNKKSLRISKEDYDKMKRYKLVEADSNKLDEFYNGSSLTFEGCTTDEDNLDYLYNWLGELNALKEGTLPIYTYKGSLMNEKYGLTGDNAYPDDLNFITVMLDDINYTNELAFKRFEIGGRWFDDIVDNNKARQDRANESFTIIKESLLEKVNLDNKEINDIIGKVLRSKTEARKYEDKLKSYGIDIDYSGSQGVKLKGSNGKTLSANSNYVQGPSMPGQNNTHMTGHSSLYASYAKARKDKYNNLKNMSKEDILKKYSGMSSEDALKAHKQELEDTMSGYNTYKDAAIKAKSGLKTTRREGHIKDPGTYGTSSKDFNKFRKGIADETVDYLNYLTKPNYGDDFRKDKGYRSIGSSDDWYYSGYPTKNPVDNRGSETLGTYKKLKNNVSQAEEELEDRTYAKNDYYRSDYGAMTDKQLEKRISNMNKDLEKEIENLRKDHENKIKEVTKQNDKNRIARDEAKTDLKNKRKELRDFMKAKRASRVKNESVELNESVDSAYIDQRLNAIYDEVLTLAQEAQHSGFNEISDKLNDVLGILDFTKVD